MISQICQKLANCSEFLISDLYLAVKELKRPAELIIDKKSFEIVEIIILPMPRLNLSPPKICLGQHRKLNLPGL